MTSLKEDDDTKSKVVNEFLSKEWWALLALIVVIAIFAVGLAIFLKVRWPGRYVEESGRCCPSPDSTPPSMRRGAPQRVIIINNTAPTMNNSHEDAGMTRPSAPQAENEAQEAPPSYDEAMDG